MIDYSSPRARIISKVKTQLETETHLPDGVFDSLFSQNVFDAASTHWTPVEVIRQALDWLGPTEETRLLDVGSGAGKFCLVAALAKPGIYTGIELRPWLNQEAQQLKAELGASGAEFIGGDMADLDWSGFDSFYFFNPFYEQIVDEEGTGQKKIDNHFDHDPALYLDYRRLVVEKLSTLKPGTKVITYHGLGGELPSSYREEQRQRVGTGDLVLYRKK